MPIWQAATPANQLDTPMEATVPLYPLAIAALGMAPLALGLWVAAADLAHHLNGGRA